jgi:hypothetical protein
MSKVDTIFLHCSDSAFGEVLVVDQWHKQRGWKRIGYHYIILNGRPYKDVRYIEFLDGQVQPGHALNDDPIFTSNEIGTHVAGRNSTSIGICLIGTTKFTNAQLLSARKVCLELVHRWQLSLASVKGHYEDPHSGKTCPNIPMGHFRDFLADHASVDFLQSAISIHNVSLDAG